VSLHRRCAILSIHRWMDARPVAVRGRGRAGVFNGAGGASPLIPARHCFRVAG
jgi:hypothetical protein